MNTKMICIAGLSIVGAGCPTASAYTGNECISSTNAFQRYFLTSISNVRVLMASRGSSNLKGEYRVKTINFYENN